MPLPVRSKHALSGISRPVYCRDWDFDWKPKNAGQSNAEHSKTNDSASADRDTKNAEKPEEQQAAVERQSSDVGATPSRSDAGKRSPEPSSGGRQQPSEGSQICLELVTPRGKSRGHEVLSPPDLPCRSQKDHGHSTHSQTF